MQRKFILIVTIGLLASIQSNASNGTQSDSARVIVGSKVVRTIDVLANDNQVIGKRYRLESLYTSTIGVVLNKQGNLASYQDNQGTASDDTFHYVAYDTTSMTNDTNYVIVRKSDLALDLYPGDANADKICNNLDILSIGIAYGQSQFVREGIYKTDAWGPVRAYNWTKANLVSNHRYSDANGDGIVDSIGDVSTIIKNYNENGGITNIKYSPAGGQSISIITSDTFKVDALNTKFSIGFKLGTSTNPIQNAYGIAFTLKYDNSLIKSNLIQFNAKKWFIDQENTLNFSHVNATTGEVDMCIVRKSGKNGQGGDDMGVVDVVVDEILGGKMITNSTFEIIKIALIDSNYNLLPVNSAPIKPIVMVRKSGAGLQSTTKQESIHYYQSNGNLVIENNLFVSNQVSIYSILGKELFTKKIGAYQATDIDINQFSSGIYFLKTNQETYKIYLK